MARICQGQRSRGFLHPLHHSSHQNQTRDRIAFAKIEFGLQSRVSIPTTLVFGISTITLTWTLTPSLWGDRGWGNQFQFRQMFWRKKKWYEINSFQIEDRIYQPNKKDLTPSNDKVFRHISDYEHHYTGSHWFNHHFHYTVTKDLDSIRDFNFLCR